MDSIQNEISGGAFFGTVIQGRDIRVLLPTAVTPALSGLPQGTDAFTGRANELGVLLDRLRSGAVTTVVSGLAGVGKTALAIHAARRMLDGDSFQGGVLFADLHGYDEVRRVAPARVLDGWLRALGIPGEHVPPTTQDRERLYRSVLTALAKESRGLLILVDNARTAADVVPLLPPEGTGCAIVTSRHSLGLLDARTVHLAALDESDGALLLARALAVLRPEDARCADHSMDARRVAELCAGLPLALRIVAALLADDPGRSLAALADDLEQARLAELEYGEATIRAAFDLSFLHLSTEQAAVFTLLPVIPGPDTSAETVAVLGGLDLPGARRVLESLARAHLVDRDEDRWRMHDLVRLYAAERTENPGEALARLMDHYRSTVDAALSHLEPSLTSEGRFPDRASALAWLDSERVSLLAAVHAVPPELVQQLPLNLGTYLSLRARHHDWIDACLAGLDAARLLLDRRREAIALNNLGIAYREAGLLDEALDAYEQGLAITRERGDRDTEAIMLTNLGGVLRRLGQGEEAIAACHEAAEVFGAAGNARGLAQARGNLGSVLRDLGRREEAIAVLREVVTDFDELGDPENAGIALNNLANALLDAELPVEAERYARDAADRQRRADARYLETEALLTVGLALRAQGRLREAAEVHERNLELLAEFDDANRAAQVAGHYGDTQAALGQLDEAYEGYYVASRLYETLRDPSSEAAMMANIGLVWLRQDRRGEAARILWTAADRFGMVGDESDEARALTMLGPLELSLGRPVAAMTAFGRAARLHRRLGDAYAEGSALATLSDVQQADSLYETASITAVEALRICRETGDRQGEHTALNTLAVALSSLKRYEEALPVHHEQVTLCRDLDDRRPLADALVNLGHTLREAGGHNESKAALREAADLYRALGDTGEAGKIAKEFTVTGRTRRLLRAAARPLRRRHALFRDLMGMKYLERGLAEDAIRCHLISSAIWRAVGDRHAEGLSILDLSTAFMAIGEYDDAGRAAEYAAQVFRYDGHEWHELLACLNHARAHSAALRPRDALPSYERALWLARALENAEAESVIASEYAEARKAPDLPGAVVWTIRTGGSA